MALYSLAQTATITASGSASADVACGANVRGKLMEAAWFLGAASASTHSLRRSTALGTRTTPTALAPEDPGDPALSGVNLMDAAIAFSVQPTLSTTKNRIMQLPATIGVGVIFTFPRGLVCAVSLSLCLVNDAINAAVVNQHWCMDG